MKKKTAILTARLTPAEKAATLNVRAKQANMTITDYIVKSALGKNVRQTDELAPILSELKAQGRNLNQLTKLANMGRITWWTPKISPRLTQTSMDSSRKFTGRGVIGLPYRHQKRKAEPWIDGGSHGYVAQDEKTQWRGISLVAGHNCVPQSSYIEFLTTKKRFHKTEGGNSIISSNPLRRGIGSRPAAGQRHRVELAEKEFPILKY